MLDTWTKKSYIFPTYVLFLNFEVMKIFSSWKDKFQNSSFYHWLKVDEEYLQPYRRFPELLQKEKSIGASRWLGFWCSISCTLCFFASSMVQFFRICFLEQDNPVYFVVHTMILVAALCFATAAVIAFRRTPMLFYNVAMLLFVFILMCVFDLQFHLQLWLGNDMSNFVFGGAMLGLLFAAVIIWRLYKNSPLCHKPNMQA